jgi:hypothetical protein
MRPKFLIARLPIALAGMLAVGSIAACSRNRDVYDPASSTYHRWNSREDAAYRRWETDRQMTHLEYSRRAADEQRAYWTWRHDHPDTDR